MKIRITAAAIALFALAPLTVSNAQATTLACNDGTLLDSFRRRGCSVTGVDPAQNLVALARGKGLEVIEGYWPDVRHELSEQFDIITAANVLIQLPSSRAGRSSAESAAHTSVQRNSGIIG